jgi:outer membrane protein OmpA-like peptidoglycan-associated protein
MNPLNGIARLAILGMAALGVLWTCPSDADACGAKLSLKGSKFHQARLAKSSSMNRQPIATGPIDTRQRDVKSAGGVEGGRAVRSGGSESARKRPASKPVARAPRKEVAQAQPQPAADEQKASSKPLGDVDKRKESADKEPATASEPDTATDEQPTPAPREGKAKGKLPRLVFFANARAELSPAAKASLDKTVKWLEANPDRSITVEGHASTRGNFAANQTLSEKRAEMVKDYLVEKGISESRINTVGRGSEHPEFQPGTSGKNRRVAIIAN